MIRRSLALALSLFALAGTAMAQDVKICVEGAYPPFSETAPSGDIVGFDIDMANALCAQMGRSCALVKTDWDGIIPALLEKKCDAIIASMTATQERRQVIDFSDKYYQTGAAFIAAKDADFTDSTADMADKVVGVQRGTSHQNYMEKYYPDTELVTYGTQDEAYLDLAAGRIDAVMADSVAMDYGFLRTPAGADYGFLGTLYFDPEIHGDGASIAVRKDDTELRDAFDAAILALRDNGTYQEIAAKYFTFDVYGN